MTGTTVCQPGSCRPGSARSDDNIEKVKDLVLSQEDKPKLTSQPVRFRMKLAFRVQVYTIFTVISSSNATNDVGSAVV